MIIWGWLTFLTNLYTVLDINRVRA